MIDNDLVDSVYKELIERMLEQERVPKPLSIKLEGSRNMSKSLIYQSSIAMPSEDAAEP